MQACENRHGVRANLAEDEEVYSHCCIHKHGRQEDVQEEICRLNPQPYCNAVADGTSFER